MASTKIKHAHGQLGLSLAGHVEAMGIECRGIFSATYLRKVFASSGDYPSETDTIPLYETVKARWAKSWFGMAKAKEAYTRTQFVGAGGGISTLAQLLGEASKPTLLRRGHQIGRIKTKCDSRPPSIKGRYRRVSYPRAVRQ